MFFHTSCLFWGVLGTHFFNFSILVNDYDLQEIPWSFGVMAQAGAQTIGDHSPAQLDPHVQLDRAV